VPLPGKEGKMDKYVSLFPKKTIILSYMITFHKTQFDIKCESSHVKVEKGVGGTQ